MIHGRGLTMAGVAHRGVIGALGTGAGRDQRNGCDGGDGIGVQTHGFSVLFGMGISAAFLCHHGPLMLETGIADHVPSPAI
jgi:hypothetical protein